GRPTSSPARFLERSSAQACPSRICPMRRLTLHPFRSARTVDPSSTAAGSEDREARVVGQCVNRVRWSWYRESDRSGAEVVRRPSLSGSGNSGSPVRPGRRTQPPSCNLGRDSRTASRGPPLRPPSSRNRSRHVCGRVRRERYNRREAPMRLRLLRLSARSLTIETPTVPGNALPSGRYIDFQRHVQREDRTVHANIFLTNLALVLCVAAVTTVVFERLRQPVVLGYLLAGIIVGPHILAPITADNETIQGLSELGVILLLFGIGLEFTIGKLLRVGAAAALVAVVEVSAQSGAGSLAARPSRGAWRQAPGPCRAERRRSRDDGDLLRRHRLCVRPPRAALRLLRRARRLSRGHAGRRVRRRTEARASPPALARSVRGHLLRLSRYVDRSLASSRALGSHPRALRRRGRRQDGGGFHPCLPYRRRRARGPSGRDEH